MQPLYFLPGVTLEHTMSAATKRDILRAHGLAEVFADVSPDMIGCNVLQGRIPECDDKSGTIVLYNSPVTGAPRRFGYHPGEQIWHRVDDGSMLWIGIDTAEPPTPDDLRRRRHHSGYEVMLGDNQRYMVPVVRNPIDGTTKLPCDQYIERGRLHEPIKDAYRKYWEASEEVATWFAGPLPILPDKFKAHALAVELLAINYRLGANEQKALRIVDGTNCGIILGCSIDYPKWADWSEAQKKTACQSPALNS